MGGVLITNRKDDVNMHRIGIAMEHKTAHQIITRLFTQVLKIRKATF